VVVAAGAAEDSETDAVDFTVAIAMDGAEVLAMAIVIVLVVLTLTLVDPTTAPDEPEALVPVADVWDSWPVM
jgi:hypothetical protein